MVSDAYNFPSPLVVIFPRFFLVFSFYVMFVSFILNSNLFLYIFIVCFLISLLHSSIHASTIQPVCPLYGVHTTQISTQLSNYHSLSCLSRSVTQGLIVLYFSLVTEL